MIIIEIVSPPMGSTEIKPDNTTCLLPEYINVIECTGKCIVREVQKILEVDCVMRKISEHLSSISLSVMRYSLSHHLT